MNLHRQCTPDECFQLTLLAVVETAANIIIDRSVPKSRRHNRLMALKEQVEQINATFDGYLPEKWIAHSMKFNQTLEVSMMRLLKTYKMEGK